MIVDSMTHEEVYVELERDRESISRWWWHQQQGRRRMVLKSKVFPLRIWQEHISARKNKYFFFTQIFEKRMREIITGVITLRRFPDGQCAYTNWLTGHKLISPMVILPHAFKRYSERCHVEKTGIDLIKHYFTHNSHGKDSTNQKAVGRSVRYAGMTHLSCCVPEGVLLGQLEGELFIVHTFITYDMCTGQQKVEFDGCRRLVLDDRELYETAKQYY